MKKKFLLLLALMWSGHLFGGALIKTFQEGVGTEKLFTTVIDEKKSQLESLEKELIKIQEESEKFSTVAKTTLAELATKSNIVKTNIKQEPQNEEFLNSKLSLFNELYPAIKDRQQAYRQTIEFVQEDINLLQKYLEDPNLEDYAKEYSSERRTVYSFENLQELNSMILVQNNNVGHLEKQEKNANAELDSRKYSADSAAKTYKKRKQELKDFATDGKTPEEMFGFDAKQKTVLLELQEQLSFEKSKLATLWSRSTDHKVKLIKTKLFIARLQLKTLEKLVGVVRPLVAIREDDVVAARSQLNKKKQRSLSIKGKYRKEEEVFARENEHRLNELKKISEKHSISLDKKLDEWSIDPKQTAKSYTNFATLGSLNAQYLVVERKKELLEALISLEDEKLRYEKLQAEVKSSFYGIKTGKFSSEEEKNKEVAKYNASEAEIDASISRFKERENAATVLLNAQKRGRAAIKALLEDVQKKRSTIFKSYPKDFSKTIFLLRDALVRIGQHIDSIEKMIGFYHDIVTTGQSARGQVAFIVDELETASGPLRRSEEAIQFEEVKRVIPDVRLFSLDLYGLVKQFQFGVFISKVKNNFPQNFDRFLLFIKLFFLFVFLFLLRFYAKKGLVWVSRFDETVGILGSLVKAILEFIVGNFIAVLLWIIIFAAIRFGVVPDYGLQMLFYLLSIPYFLYLANRFLYQIVTLNESKDHFILTKHFQARFSFIVSILLYSTIGIQLFRTAFILGPYQGSGLPKILLALNFIILQVSLIFLITKEQVLNLIPITTAMWKQVHAQVDKYFYLILAFVIAIIVMINPFVGFGQLVRFIIFRLFLTIVLLRALYWIQAASKKVASKLFFSIDDDAAKERFSSAKSWYGLFMILLFLILALVGFVIAAQVWGWQITLDDIKTWMTTGREVSFVSLSKVLGFVAAGFFLAFAFNKFILRRIFDLLLVEMGVQQAVVGLTRYLIIIALTVVGLERAGLGPLTKWLLGILVAIAWIIKEPLGDLVAYFILLIQRPLKIGDYVKLDETTSGVVRRITPRSIIIRQKNSTTIVVPNSHVLGKAVVNWNYVSGFVAIDDIVVKVSFKEDPDKVIELISQAIDGYQNVLKSPKPVIRLEHLGDYSFDFLVRCYVSSHFTLDMWKIAGDIRLLVVRTLRENGIELALPKSIWVSPKDEEKTPPKIEKE